METLDDDALFARGIALMREVLGDEAAEATLARHLRAVEGGDPERNDFPTIVAWGFMFGRSQLALRDRAIVLLVSDIVQGTPLALRDHVRLALHAGLTRAELDEILFQLTPYLGFPRTREAGVIVRQLLADLDAGRPIERHTG